jgi:hypothetical protein
LLSEFLFLPSPPNQWNSLKILSIVLCVGESGRESADAVASVLQKIQVNSEERDVAVRLFKTGGLSVSDFINTLTFQAWT